MEIKYRYVTIGYNKLLEEELKERKIHYRIENDINDSPNYMVFYLNDKQKKEIAKSFIWLCITSINEKECVFSEKELENCDYLQMICQNPGVEILNEEECFSYRCYHTNIFGAVKCHHRIQTGLFTLKQKSKARTKHFYIDHLDHNLLFSDSMTKNLLECSGITGIKWLNVFRNNQTVSEYIYQLRGDEIIGGDKLSYKYGKEKKCKYCGKKKRLVWDICCSPIIVNQELKNDFYETDPVFGGYETPVYIVSSKLYKLLKENSLIRGCAFVPVIAESN